MVRRGILKDPILEEVLHKKLCMVRMGRAPPKNGDKRNQTTGEHMTKDKTKSLILYGSPQKLTGAHKLASHSNQPEYYVRVDTFNGDYQEAIENADPMEGETVLNSVPIGGAE